MIEIFANRCRKFEPVGSRVTCNPPPEDTDADYLCLIDRGPNAATFYNLLHDNGFVNESILPTGEQKYGEMMREEDDIFESWRKDEVNIILTYSDSFFNKFMAASDVCRHLNLMNKEDRVMVFEAVRIRKRHP